MRYVALALMLAGCSAAPPPPPPPPAAPDGATLFSQNCALCHQADGAGVPGQYPPLKGSEFVTGPPERMVRIVLAGLSGPVKVAGQTYDGQMPAFGPQFSDEELALVTTWVRHEFGGAGPVPPELVKKLRPQRDKPWTVQELKG